MNIIGLNKLIGIQPNGGAVIETDRLGFYRPIGSGDRSILCRSSIFFNRQPLDSDIRGAAGKGMGGYANFYRLPRGIIEEIHLRSGIVEIPFSRCHLRERRYPLQRNVVEKQIFRVYTSAESRQASPVSRSMLALA